MFLGRRSVLLGSMGALACGRPPAAPRRLFDVDLWSWFDLPASDPRSHELSGIAWDERARLAWCVQDEVSRIVALAPSSRLDRWQIAETVEVDAGVDGKLDLEGIVATNDGFVVCSEVGPRVFEIDRQGRFRRDVELPSRFKDARYNKSVESLTQSPSGRYLFATSEIALGGDGEPPLPVMGTRVRVVRIDREGTETTEHLYVTDPAPDQGWDWGVSDLAALGDDDLLVLERGFRRDVGNAIRIYRIHLDPRSVCTGVAQLSAAQPTLMKWLFLDVADLHPRPAPPAFQPQSNSLLDNYEGLCLGPHLPDGRRSLLLVSDDNGHATQIARVLVLAF
jgi:hypothetical protein